MDEAEIDKERNDELVTDIIVEDCNIPNPISIREAAIEKIKRMTDEEIKQKILL